MAYTKTKRIGWAVCLSLAAMTASAGTVGLHLGSKHFPARSFNDANPGAYYISDEGWTVGTYYNSERKQSVYAGKSWDFGPFRLQAGLITGYSRHVLPMVAPSVALGAGFRLTVLPKVERGGSSVIHLTWETKL